MTTTRERAEDQAIEPRRPGLLRGRTLGWRVFIICALMCVTVIGITAAIRVLNPAPDPAPAVITPPDPAQQADGKAPEFVSPPAPGQVPNCANLPAVTGTPDLTTPPPTTWTLVGGMAAPSSPDAGPALTKPVRSCYAPTPTGALFAITNYLAQMQDPAATPAGEIALATATMADTPERAKWLNQWETPTHKPVTGADVRPEFAAFHFIAYSPDIAIIDIASAWNGHLDAGTYTARYASGTWLIEAPVTSNARWPMRQLPIEDKNYFTHWSAS